MRDTKETASMYERYVPSELQKGASRSYLVNLCMKWAQELSLHDILDEQKYSEEDGENEIEKTIQILQNVVSFNIPLLLKPIFDIKNPESVFLTCMQSGAMNNVTKKLIELGVPRETALYIYRGFFKERKIDTNDDLELEKNIRDLLFEQYGNMPRWIKCQLEFLI